jgi:hypothetical protein
MHDVEKSFATTSSLIFGKGLEPLKAYVAWLERGLPFPIVERKSRVSGKTLFMLPRPAYIKIQGNIAGIEEALEIGKLSLSEKEAFSLSLKGAVSSLSKISTTCPNVIFSENFDTEDSICFGPTQHCFRIAFSWWSKYASCCYDVRTSAHVHGCSELDDCNFCIRCRQSSKLQRCFEVDESSNCSDCCYCHNLENCHDCMFCFNAKNLKNAVGNVEYSRDKYLEIKNMVLHKLLGELEEKKGLRLDIYSLGALNAKK